MYLGSAESFGKQWQVGDVVGVFLDLIDHTISKAMLIRASLTLSLLPIIIAKMFYLRMTFVRFFF